MIELIYILVITVLVLLVFFAGMFAYSSMARVRQLDKQATSDKELADLKLRFFTNISHELRTPLTLIIGPVENMLADPSLPANVRAQMDIVDSNAKRMLRMVNQILDFRQLNNGKLRLQVQNVPLAPLVSATCGNFVREAELRHIQFSQVNDVPDVELWIDPDKVDIILYNLLSNAFKYTADGQRISVHVMQKKDFVCVQVSDTGMGIPNDKRSVLFERFSSHNEINKDAAARLGSGIGLNLVKELIDLHGGYIAVESEEGVGTTFNVMFRQGRDHYSNDVDLVFGDTSAVVPVKDGRAAVLPFTSNAAKPSLLVVDDHPDMRQFLATVLADRFTITLAQDGEDGYEKAMTIIPDLIITDLMMPKMDGLELTDKLKNTESTSHIPLILLTAKSAIESRLDALRFGADDYITKPFSAEYLIARIDNLIAQRKRLQETYRNAIINLHAEQATEQQTPDEIFLKNLTAFMFDNMDNSELTVDELVSHMAVGRTVFFNKLKALTGLSPVEFIREMRIKQAAHLLEDSSHNITEVTYMVGFNDSRYFAKCFKAVYGMTPSEYRRAHAAN